MSTLILKGEYECPRFNKLVTMLVEYQEVTTRQAGRHFKRGLITNDYCSTSDDCSLKDSHGRCPVYLQFPNPKII